MDFPSSRNLADLTPEMARAFQAMKAAFNAKHPSLPQPFLTQTYRNHADQDADYAKGRTAPGKVITNAKAGQSLHNYYPSYAFDVAFKDSAGNVSYTQNLFNLLGQIALSLGIGWGGAWQGKFHDYPHFEPKGFTWEMAASAQRPVYPPAFAEQTPPAAPETA